VQSAFFQFKYFDIFRPISELLGELNEYKPGIVAAQPSILVEICRALIDKRISILPNQIISFAEVLHENDKILFENSFKIKISEVYQCMEGFLGATCALGVMHLNEDFIMFEKEWLDQEHFYPIITDFSRYSQPLVKYKLTDILKIKNTPCKCGSQNLAIEKIIGRNDDILIFNNIKIYPDLIARRIAQITNAFQRYTIVQVSEKKLEIAIESEEIYFESLKKEFRIALNSILEPYCINNIDYFFTNKIEFVPSNKTRKIKRLICENNI
jgi:putative adenylate-forming enzyme